MKILRENKPTKEQVENAYDSLIRDLITKSWDLVDGYSSVISTLNAENNVDKELVQKLNALYEQATDNISILESCLSNTK